MFMFFLSEIEIKLSHSTLKSLSNLIICSFVTSFSKFLFGHNLAYWFLGSSDFVYVDISDGDYGRSFFLIGVLLLSVNAVCQH
jgi:ABC-type sulfate transport system permease component